MGNIAGSHPNLGAGRPIPRFVISQHPQSAFDKARGKDAVMFIYDAVYALRVKEWLTHEEARAMCKLLNESEKL